MKEILTCWNCRQQIEVEEQYNFPSVLGIPYIAYRSYIDKCPKCNKDHAYVDYYEPDYPKI